MINQFNGQYSFLSNFHMEFIYYDGYMYNSAEQLYQSFKACSLADLHLIQDCPGPKESKRQAQQIVIRPGWEEVKDEYMYRTLMCKFSQSPSLLDELIGTYPHSLEEGNKHHDNYWGNCSCDNCSELGGKNKLGRLLMDVRKILE